MYNTLDYIKRGIRFANNILRPSQKKISTLMFYATDLCDSRCKHCMVWAKRPIQHLSFEKIVEIMNSKSVNKNTNVGLEGGEFLLHPEADKILGWFSKNHPNFDLLSNCLRPQKVIDAVHKYKPKRLFLSLDGTAESYKYMRGVDGFDRVLQVIKNCKDSVPISAMFTLSPYNDFDDLDKVIAICKDFGIDIRVGIYNDIDFFDTIEKAHETEIGMLKSTPPLTNQGFKINAQKKLHHAKNEPCNPEYKTLDIPKHDESRLNIHSKFQKSIPESIKTTSENFDFLLLYEEWRKKHTKLRCHSILDSVVIHPNGDVPICQNLNTKLGNVNDQSIDEIFNSQTSQVLQKKHSENCNLCWINFHRKYDIVMLRSFEKILPKPIIELAYGKYQWCSNEALTYKEYMRQFNDKKSDKTSFSKKYLSWAFPSTLFTSRA